MWERQTDSAAKAPLLGQKRTARSSWDNVRPRLSFMFPVETFELIKRLLTLNVAKARQNAETILNSYDLFIYTDIV